ncbi:MAG: AsnC family transcriptional regulator [Nitrososphaerota archaeon]|nr:AsnC family transcriptional regulator [Nitrososphaerota archaeon]
MGVALDELDVRIIRELTHSNHEGIAWGELSPSYAMIAKKLACSRATIRERVERMLESGFLRTFPVQVNPSLLGLMMGAMSVDVPPAAVKEEIVRRLSLVEGMLVIATHVGSLIGLVFYYESESDLQKKGELIASLCDATSLRWTPMPYPRATVELSRRDWQIVSALQRAWPRPPEAIARELGVSTRTLRRRTKRMVEGMAISTVVSADLGAMRGGVVANLEVNHDAGTPRAVTDAALQADLEHYTIYAGLWAEYSMLTLVLPSITEGLKVLGKVRRVKGVSSARLDLLEDRVEFYSTLREKVERRLRLAGAGIPRLRTA